MKLPSKEEFKANFKKAVTSYPFVIAICVIAGYILGKIF